MYFWKRPKTFFLSLFVLLTSCALSPLKEVPRLERERLQRLTPPGTLAIFDFQAQVLSRKFYGSAVLNSQEGCLRLEVPSVLGPPVIIAYLARENIQIALPLEGRALIGSLDKTLPQGLLRHPQGLIQGLFDSRWGTLKDLKQRNNWLYAVLFSPPHSIRLKMDRGGRLSWLKVLNSQKQIILSIYYHPSGLNLDYWPLSLSLKVENLHLERSLLDCQDLSFKIPSNFQISILKERR